jgi:hypothetical protein
MASVVQRGIYSISNTVPILVVGALVWWLQKKTLMVPLLLVVIVIIITTIFYWSFNKTYNKLSPKTINISGVENQDSWILAYVLAYLLPFANLVIDDYNIVVVSVVALILLMIIIPAVFSLPNFLLYLKRYHFYRVETDETGMKDYILISKKKRYRKSTDVRRVVRMFEKLLIDMEGDK